MGRGESGRIRAGGQKPGFSRKYFATTGRSTKKPGFSDRSIKRGQKPGFSRKYFVGTQRSTKKPGFFSRSASVLDLMTNDQ